MTELPPGWVETTIGEVCDVIMGQSPPGESYNGEATGMPFLQGKAEFGDLRPTVRKWTTAAKKVAEEDDVLLSVRAPVGPTNLAPVDCAIGRGLVALHPLGAIDSRFILYAVRGSVARLIDHATGTTFSAISRATVRDHSILLPPLREQYRIIDAIEEHFSRLDAAERSLHEAVRRLDHLRSVAIGRATQGEWPVVRLSDVTNEQIYGSSAKASPGVDGGVPVLRMGNIRSDGSLDLSDLKYLPPAHPDVEKYSLRRGDVLFNRTNSPELVGKSAVFKSGPSPAAFASYLIRVRLTDECIPDWAVLVINSAIGRHYVAQVRTQQVGQANVNGTKLAAMPLPLPPLHEQQRIVAELQHQLSIIEALDAAIQSARKRSAALRRSILERAFRGTLVSQDPTDEPAFVLLERIERARDVNPEKARRPAGRRGPVGAARV